MVLIGGTLTDGVCACEDTVAVVASRCTGDDVDFEGFTLSVELLSFGCYGLSDYFGRTGSGETGKSAFGVVEKQFGRLFGSQDRKFHNFLVSEFSGGEIWVMVMIGVFLYLISGLDGGTGEGQRSPSVNFGRRISESMMACRQRR